MALRTASPLKLPEKWSEARPLLEQLAAALQQQVKDSRAELGGIAPQQDAIVTVAWGDTVRVSPVSTGMTLVFPGADAINRGERITIHNIAPQGVLQLRPVTGTINGEAALSFALYGSVTLVSDGLGDALTERGGSASADDDEEVAPLDAEYLLGSTNATLTSSRVAGASTEVSPDRTVPGVISWLLNTASILFAKLQDMTGLSVLGRAASSTGVMAAITASANNQALRRTSNTLNWGAVTNAMLDTDVTWSAVLARGNGTGIFPPNIHTFAGSYLSFGDEAFMPASGSIRSFGNLLINVTGSATMQASTSAIVVGATGAGFTTAIGQLQIQAGPTATPAATDFITLAAHNIRANVLAEAGATGFFSIDGPLVLSANGTPGYVATNGDGVFWVDDPGVTVPMFRDDAAVDHTLAYLVQVSPGQQLGLQVDAAGVANPIAITGAEQGENIRFNTLQLEVTPGTYNAYSAPLPVTIVEFSNGAYVINGIANVGSEGRPLLIRHSGTGSTTINNQSGLAATADQVTCTGGVAVKLIASEFAILAHRDRWRMYALSALNKTDSPGFPTASGGGTTNFWRADMTWAAPAGGSSSAIVSSDHILGADFTLAADKGAVIPRYHQIGTGFTLTLAAGSTLLIQ